MVSGKTLLITGGTGTFGNAVPAVFYPQTQEKAVKSGKREKRWGVIKQKALIVYKA